MPTLTVVKVTCDICVTGVLVLLGHLALSLFEATKNGNRLWSARISSLRCMHARYMQCLNDQARGLSKIDKELIKV